MPRVRNPFRLTAVTKLLLPILYLTLTMIPVTLSLSQPYNVSEIADNFVGRFRSLGKDSPVSTALGRNATLQRMVVPLFRMVDTVSDLVEKRRREVHPEACNLHRSSAWSVRSASRPKILQIGELHDDCFTLIDANIAEQQSDLPKGFVDFAADIIDTAKLAFLDATRSVPVPDDGNWSDSSAPYILRPLARIRKGQRCAMESAFAYRREGEWYLRTAFTNRDAKEKLPDWHRHVVQEWVPRHYNHSLKMVHKKFDSEELETSTTVLHMGEGRVFTSSSGMGGIDGPVAPIGRAYRSNLVVIDQASDSVTVSNIAILALPMAMTIIPVSYVADVNAVGMVAYVLVTDVFAAVPFLIKGVELVRSSLPQRRHVLAFYTGDRNFSQLEIFAAQCRGQVYFRTTGIVFIVVALLALIAGIVIEVWAWKAMRRKNAAKVAEPLSGPFGNLVKLGEHYELDYLVKAEREERAYVSDKLAAQARNVQNLIDVGAPTSQPSSKWTWRSSREMPDPDSPFGGLGAGTPQRQPDQHSGKFS